MDMTKDELAFVPALELRGMIGRREVSPVEVTELFLERNRAAGRVAELVPDSHVGVGAAVGEGG